MECSVPLTTLKKRSAQTDIIGYFSQLKIDESWIFEELSRKDRSYITHDYHRYPAKFIPQLASRLIREYSEKDDLICDPFMGSGTALVEALVNHRRAIGVDINPAAYIISKAKTTPIEPNLLEKLVNNFFRELDNVKKRSTHQPLIEHYEPTIPQCDRIDYWFTEKSKKELGLILTMINDVEREDFKTFLKCGFSHILKNCSRWLMTSTKPTIDKDKSIPEPISTFKRHI